MKKHRDSRPPLSYADKIQLTISYTLKAVMLVIVLMSFVRFNLFLMFSSMVILVFSALPAIVERTFRIILPMEVDLILTLFVFSHLVLGETGNYYNRYWFWDLAMHASSGIMVGIVGFVIIYFLLYSSRITANPFLVSVLSISFSLAAGALWEIFEFTMDQIFGFNMQKSGLMDTMTDLIVDLLGACTVGVGVYRYLKKNEDGLVKLMINRFIQFNLRLRSRRLVKKGIENTSEEL